MGQNEMGRKKAAARVRMPSTRTLRKRLALYIEARAILAVAALARKKPMSYFQTFRDNLAFCIRGRQAVDLADAIYNDANGPEDWTPESEERALARCNSHIDQIRIDLGMELH